MLDGKAMSLLDELGADYIEYRDSNRSEMVGLAKATSMPLSQAEIEPTPSGN